MFDIDNELEFILFILFLSFSIGLWIFDSIAFLKKRIDFK